MDAGRLESWLEENAEPKYRAAQIRQAVFKDHVSSYDEIPTLPLALRKRLSRELPILSVSPDRIEISRDGRARKAVLRLSDGRLIETVLLKPSPTRLTTCISSQVGCAIRCSFCATGLMGLTRSLSAEEIADQVLFWRQHIAREGIQGFLTNVVYMGMGEPFNAYNAVAESLRRLTDQRQFAMAARRISVSTSGVAPKIARFGQEFPQINLALSLHAAEDGLRESLVPLNKAYPLKVLAQALRGYLQETNRKIFLEYVMLHGRNDSLQNAKELVQFAKSCGPLPLLHVNLIAYNEAVPGQVATAEPDIRRFQAALLKEGLAVTVRQNLGRDIHGACGQLLVGEMKTPRNVAAPAGRGAGAGS
jgi:23S rRNA (adenine(2503)-C(2))-methyltransferase